MTIYSDAIGNKFLGDCIWGNHEVGSPTIKHLRSYPHSSLSAELSALGTQSFGSKLYAVQSQTLLNEANQTQPNVLISWTPTSDNQCASGRARFAIATRNFDSSNNEFEYAGYFHMALFSDTGFNNSLVYSMPSERIANLTIGDIIPTVTAADRHIGERFTISDSTVSQRTWTGVSDDNSLALFQYQKRLTTNRIRFLFRYQGLLADVNTGFSYYNTNIVNHCIMFYARSTGITDEFPSDEDPINSVMAGGHFIANNPKLCLTTGDAQYPIVCADGQNPTSQWATDMYVFDNNATLGYPAIGRVRNLLLAQGTYTIGKPVRIQGTAQPDNGFNAWLPVGTYAGKTVLMRCYSSVSL